MIKTSYSHPLRIDLVQPLGVPGSIGMTFCPGKKQKAALSGGEWNRDLDVDIDVLVDWGCTALLSLIEDHELEELQVKDLSEKLNGKIAYYRMPIIDGGIPDASTKKTWSSIGPELRQRLINGERIVIHCKGGLGRTGTIVAQLLIEFGENPENAIRFVREAREGAIENAIQENYIRSCHRNLAD